MNATAHLNVEALTIAVGLVIPLLTSLVTKEKAPQWVKYLINALLSAIAGVTVTVIHANGDTTLANFVVAIATAWGSSIVSHLGLWMPTSVTAKLDHLLPEFGIGTEQVAEAEELVGRFSQTLESDLVAISGIPAATGVNVAATPVQFTTAVPVTYTSTPSTAVSPDPARVEPSTSDKPYSSPLCATYSVTNLPWPPIPGTSVKVSDAIKATDEPLEPVVQEVVQAAEPFVADPSVKTAEEVAPAVVEDVAPVVEADLPAPAAAVVAAEATDAPTLVSTAEVDPKAAAIQAVKDALDSLLKAVA
jgi:hypothetical protein